jgi:hypothetical protein
MEDDIDRETEYKWLELGLSEDGITTDYRAAELE